MTIGTRIRVTRDCVNIKTGKVWIEEGATGTLRKIFGSSFEFRYEVLLDDERRIVFRRESITPEKKGCVC